MRAPSCLEAGGLGIGHTCRMDATVENLVRSTYGVRADQALQILSRYGAERWHREVARTQRAILSLSGGDLVRLAENVEVALLDYRDTLYNAEYRSKQPARRGLRLWKRRT
jgi:hypothetical protein